jgi:hypothetical protein
LNGGELLLTDWSTTPPFTVVDANNKPVNAFDQLRTGQWVFVCGPHPNSSMSEPRLALNWYQVLAIDTPVSGMLGYDVNKPQKVVSLRGPQWPWQPPSGYNSPDASANLCVGIFRGAVAVHSKTMRLEGHGSAFSVSSGGASAGPPVQGGAGGPGGESVPGGAGSPGTTPPDSVFF